jgi:hypothetical protein
MAPLPVTPLHLGALHPYEQTLVFVLAFGPFVVLAFVLYFARKRDVREEAEAYSAAKDAAKDDAKGRLRIG